MGYDEEMAAIEKAYNEREAKESDKVDKAFKPKETEEMYREHLIAKAAEDHHQAEVDKLKCMSEDELQAAYERAELTKDLESDRSDIPWFSKPKDKGISKQVLKFS
ncbi:MAG: hypothetical protein NTX42_01275 [Methanothrix sp.]|nr:hypothetical protein [Methanothrix sp.]